jgi:hypothetical protein
MQQIINNKLYDTKTAIKIMSIEKGFGCEYSGYNIYKTTKGSLFKEEVWFDCAKSKYERLSLTSFNEIVKLGLTHGYSIEKLNSLMPELNLNIEVA